LFFFLFFFFFLCVSVLLPQTRPVNRREGRWCQRRRCQRTRRQRRPHHFPHVHRSVHVPARHQKTSADAVRRAATAASALLSARASRYVALFACHLFTCIGVWCAAASSLHDRLAFSAVWGRWIAVDFLISFGRKKKKKRNRRNVPPEKKKRYPNVQKASSERGVFFARRARKNAFRHRLLVAFWFPFRPTFFLMFFRVSFFFFFYFFFFLFFCCLPPI
jgi:hypothetical protein